MVQQKVINVELCHGICVDLLLIYRSAQLLFFPRSVISAMSYRALKYQFNSHVYIRQNYPIYIRQNYAKFLKTRFRKKCVEVESGSK